MSKLVYNKLGCFRADVWESLQKETAERRDEMQKNRTHYTLQQRVDEAVHYMTRRYNFDSGQTNLMIRSMTHMLSTIKEVLYPGDILGQAVPINTEGGAGLISQNYQQIDYKGQLEEITATSTDLREVTSITNEFGRKVGIFGGTYSNTVIELERAARGTQSLQRNKARAGSMAVQKTKNNVFWNGSKTVNGLFDYALNNQTANINGDWANATGQQIFDDIAQVVTTPGDFTEEFDADYLCMSSDLYGTMLKTFRNDNSNDNMMELIMTKLGLSAVLKTSYLKSVTSSENSLSDARLIVAYPRDPMILEFMLPRDVQVFPTEKRGMKFCTDMLFDTSGTFVYHPKAIAFGQITSVPNAV